MRCHIRYWLLLMLSVSIASPSFAAETLILPTTVITATRSERSAFDTPQAVTVIDSVDIEQANASSTPDLFRYSEGVYVQKSNLGGGSPFIRGLTGKQVLLMVDGVRLNNSFYRFGPHQYLNTIDTSIIDRIEVVRGPTSVLYGSDALGGTINIITRDRDDFSEPRAADGLFRAQYLSAASAGVFRAQLEGNWHTFGVIGGVTGKLYGDLDGGGNLGRQDPSGYHEIGVDLKATTVLGSRHKFTLANQYTRQYDVPKTNEVTLGDKLQFNYEPQERLLTYLDYTGKDLPYVGGMKINLSLNRQREGEEIIERKAPTAESREVTDVKTFGALLQFSTRVGAAQRFTYGFDYYRDFYDTDKFRLNLAEKTRERQNPSTPDGSFYESWAVYAQDEISLWSKLEAILGVRYSHFATAGKVGNTDLAFSTDALTGSVNLLYRLTPRINLVSGFAKGFRAPNMEDFFGRVDFFREIPNADLKSEESFSKEFGVKYASERATADVYYFHSDYDGFIDRVTVGSQPDGAVIQQRRNIRDAVIQGVESGVTLNLHKQWRVSGTFAWTEGEDRDTHEPLRRIPPIYGTVRARYTHTPRLWLEVGAVLTDSQTRLAAGDKTDPRIGPSGTPGYGVFDVRAGYLPFPNHSLLFTVENLSDKKYKTHGSGIFHPGVGVNVTYQITFH